MNRLRNRILLAAVAALLCGLAMLPLARHLGREAAVRTMEVAPADASQVHDGPRSRAISVDKAEAPPPGPGEKVDLQIAQSSPRSMDQPALADPAAGSIAPPASKSPPPKRGKPPTQDPLARVALAFVGEDPWAEAYWYLAINDPGLPPTERQDLIEDLNEDGLTDPKRPTWEDLPLIVSRIWLIEEVGWEAMDQVNADAFAEAYKDLVNLANVALGGGEPVR